MEEKRGVGKPMNEKGRELFVDAYIKNTCSVKDAAEELGFPPITCYEWMREPAIKAAIRARLDETKITADEIEAMLRQMSEVTLADFLDKNGNILVSKIKDYRLKHAVTEYSAIPQKDGSIRRTIKLAKIGAIEKVMSILKLGQPPDTNININIKGMTDAELDAKIKELESGG